MSSFFQVVTTVESEEQARALARQMLEERLAGCVQISPCRSLYHWQGEIEEAGEYVCTLKTSDSLVQRLISRLAAVHPYEVPEILALPVADGHRPYLDWLDSELAPKSGTGT